MLYNVRSITDKKTPGHGTINVICVPDIVRCRVPTQVRGEVFLLWAIGRTSCYDSIYSINSIEITAIKSYGISKVVCSEQNGLQGGWLVLRNPAKFG